MVTYSGKFYPPCYNEASHHAFPRNLLFNNSNSGTSITDFIHMNPLETLADAIMREVYSNDRLTKGLYHQSLVVGGNKENLNIML